MRFARAWAMRAPRAAGWLPRQIGRRYGRDWRVVIQTENGISLAVDPNHLDTYTWLLRVHTPESAVVETCLRLLRPGDVFYDIGANVGYISLSVSRHFSSQVHVIAFEPQPNLARLILVSARLNNLESMTVFPTMVGGGNGWATLFVPSHSIHASAISREHNARALQSPVVTLDTLLRQRTIPRPDVIKIDVEGAELDVVRGAEELLRHDPPYVIFEADENMGRFGYTRGELFDVFRRLGKFEFFRLRPGGPVPIGEDDLDDFASDNDFVAVPPGRLQFADLPPSGDARGEVPPPSASSS
jgi:FkbM family methyltransferase